MKKNAGLKNAPEKKGINLSQVVFMDFVENDQNNWFTEHLYVAASDWYSHWELIRNIKYYFS